MAFLGFIFLLVFLLDTRYASKKFKENSPARLSVNGYVRTHIRRYTLFSRNIWLIPELGCILDKFHGHMFISCIFCEIKGKKYQEFF